MHRNIVCPRALCHRGLNVVPSCFYEIMYTYNNGGLNSTKICCICPLYYQPVLNSAEFPENVQIPWKRTNSVARLTIPHSAENLVGSDFSQTLHWAVVDYIRHMTDSDAAGPNACEKCVFFSCKKCVFYTILMCNIWLCCREEQGDLVCLPRPSMLLLFI